MESVADLSPEIAEPWVERLPDWAPPVDEVAEPEVAPAPEDPAEEPPPAEDDCAAALAATRAPESNGRRIFLSSFMRNIIF